MMTRSALLVLCLAALAVVAPLSVRDGVRALADVPRVQALPAPVRQGDCLFVFAHPEAPQVGGECQWGNRTYPLYPLDGGWRAILPVPPEMAAGWHKLLIVLRDTAGSATQAPLSVSVSKRNFGVQKLHLGKSSARLYSIPEAEQERQAIHDALTRANPHQAWRGPFAWPCQGRLRTGFGVARSVNGQVQYRHRGLDIGAPAGTPVLAAEAGVVSLARDNYKLHGKTVALDHGQGVGSLYLHLSEICVREGQQVERGERIGRVGATGVATGPHLHWAVYVNGEAVEPRFWINLPATCR